MISFYATQADELAAVRRAAMRAGCEVERARVAPARLLVAKDGLTSVDATGGPSQVLGSLACRDGWRAAWLLLALAVEDAHTPGARELAASLRAVAPSDEDFARAVHAFVRSRVRFVRERGEIFQSGAMTLNRGAGDCDDHARLVYALAVAGGLPARMAILWRGASAPADRRGPAHAVALLCPAGRCAWAETTVAALYGENPNDAAARLGLTSARADLAREVVVMGEEELPAVPAGFDARSDAAQVARDAEALQRLGYLSSDTPSREPAASDPFVRAAVAAFQASRPSLVVDGLLGPATRAALACALSEAGPPVTEGFDYAAMSGIGALAAVVPKLSADLPDAFFVELLAMAARFRARGCGASAEDFARVWFVESAGLHAYAPNGLGQPFGGLNQMGPNERRAAGFYGTFADWLALTAREQLPFVERYYAPKPVQFIRDSRGVYVATFAPAFLASSGDPSVVLYRAPSDNYRLNAVFDRPRADGTRKGFITIGDLAAPIDAVASNPRWVEIQSRIRALDGGAPPASAVAGAVAALVGVGLAAATGVYLWWQA